MKKCRVCGEVKPIEEFYKHKNMKDGRVTKCKSCKVEYDKNRLRTLKGRVLQIYSTQKRSSKRRGYNPPSYSRDEFVNWMLSNEDYLRIFNEWVNSGYDNMLLPSCDRLDDYKCYSFDNIRVVTWEENNNKGYLDRKSGINNKLSKAVVKMDLNGNEIKEYYSMRQAARDIGGDSGNIWRVCNGTYTKYGGFKWKYADRK